MLQNKNFNSWKLIFFSIFFSLVYYSSAILIKQKYVNGIFVRTKWNSLEHSIQSVLFTPKKKTTNKCKIYNKINVNSPNGG